jgi:hypothetical protein
MKTRKTMVALCATATFSLCSGPLFSQIYTPGGNVLSNTSGSGVGIGTAAPGGNLEVYAEGASPATLLLQNTQSLFSAGNDPTEPAFALKIMRQMAPSMGLPGDNNTTFTIAPTGRTAIGTFPAEAPDMLAVGGSLGLFLSPANFLRLRTTGTGAEMIWNTNSNGSLSFKSQNTGITGMRLSPEGKLAIGSTALDGDHLLRVKGSEVAEVLQVQLESDWGTNNNTLGLSTDQGNHIYWRTPNQQLEFRSEGNTPMVLHSSGKVGINTDQFVGEHLLRVKGSEVAEVLQVQPESDWGTDNNSLGLSTDQGNHIYWHTPNEQLEFRSEGNTPMVLHSSGKVGINTDHFVGDHSLYIEGSMIMEEGVVKLVADWPDYVFEPNYDLMPITELGTYIDKHKRLPGMPSAAQVAEDGLELGETQRLLSEKVEELTLYIISLQLEISQLKEKIYND